MNNILKIEKLKKIYHTKRQETLAVENFSFELKKGEFVAIVGPSGCGKSTILSILCGLEQKSDGNIILDDNINIGYMLQNDALFEWRNILNNCLLGLETNKNLFLIGVSSSLTCNGFVNSFLNIKYITSNNTNPDITEGKNITLNIPRNSNYCLWLNIYLLDFQL